MRRTQRRNRRQSPYSSRLRLERLERRFVLDAIVGWNGATLSIGWDPSKAAGEDVLVDIVRDKNLGTYVEVKTSTGAIIWDGPNPNQVVLASSVQGIDVTGSPYHDLINLSPVTAADQFNIARGKITIDCSILGPNLTVGDEIWLGGFGELVDGSLYADYIDGDPDLTYGDTIHGNGGSDKIFGGGGGDQIYVGATNDGKNLGPGRPVVHGGGGDDYIEGGDIKSELYGDSGNNYIKAGDFGDTLIGGSGDDTLWGGAGTDTIEGSKRDDLIVCDTVIRGRDGPFGPPPAQIRT